MCLNLNVEESESKIANEDIVVYKISGKSILFGKFFLSQFKFFLYKKDKPTKKIKIVLNEHDKTGLYETVASINEGYYAFDYNYIRYKLWSCYNSEYGETCKVYKFIIPKGTKYYAEKLYPSNYSINGYAIAAEQIIYKGKITDKVKLLKELTDKISIK